MSFLCLVDSRPVVPLDKRQRTHLTPVHLFLATEQW